MVYTRYQLKILFNSLFFNRSTGAAVAWRCHCHCPFFFMPWHYSSSAALLSVPRRCLLHQGWATALFFAALCSAVLCIVPLHFSSSHEGFFMPQCWHVSCLGIGDCVVSCCGIGNCIPRHWLLPFCVMLQHCHFPERCNTGNFLDVPFFSGKWCN